MRQYAIELHGKITVTAVCDEDERDLIEKMVLATGDYVRAVVHMKTKPLNDAVQARSFALPQSNLPPIYTGFSARREYGDFAIALTGEIFSVR